MLKLWGGATGRTSYAWKRVAAGSLLTLLMTLLAGSAQGENTLALHTRITEGSDPTQIELDLVMDFDDPTVGGGVVFSYDPTFLGLVSVDFDPTLGDDPDFHCPGSSVISCPADPGFVSFGNLNELHGAHRVATLVFDIRISRDTRVELAVASPFGEFGGSELEVTAIGTGVQLPSLTSRGIAWLVALFLTTTLWTLRRTRLGAGRVLLPMALLAVVASTPTTALGADFDSDGIEDELDNCPITANADQRDTNVDGYGNLCDADLDNNGTIGDAADLDLLKSAFDSADPDADLDGDGVVDFLDLGRFRALQVLMPVIHDPPFYTNDNPLTITGRAQPNQFVIISVGGVEQQTAFTAPDGMFVASVYLYDGDNTLTGVATDLHFTSPTSAPVSTFFESTRSHDFTDLVISTDTVLTEDGGTPYVVTGSLTIASGATLILQSGATLAFEADASLAVDGVLLVRGTEPKPVSFTSNSGVPDHGDWAGIEIGLGSTGSGIEYAVIEYAQRGVDVFDGAEVTITNSTIREFSWDGIRVKDSADVSIVGNVIENFGGGTNAACISVEFLTGDVTIEGNEIRGCLDGIYVRDASPTIIDNLIELNTEEGIDIQSASDPSITGNEIRDNRWGIQLYGGGGVFDDPMPSVSDNQIHSNTDWNFGVSGAYDWPLTTVINVENNYWGTVDPEAIGLTIYDRRSDIGVPTADFVPFLDAVGTPVAEGNLLNGLITATQALVANTEYQVVGTYAVAVGVTLRIQEGVTLKFASTSALEVDGRLLVRGVSGNPVTMTSLASSPARGDWRGICIDATSTGSEIEYAVIEYAATGIAVFDSASVTARDSVIREFSTDGIALSGGANALIDTNLIDNSSGAMEGDGIDLDSVMGVVTIQDNEILGVNAGVFVKGASSPTITGNEIRNNRWGIQLYGGGGVLGDPAPSVSDNRIHSNTDWNFNISSIHEWVDPLTTAIDVENNYWGTIDPEAIGLTIHDRRTDIDLPTVDFVPFLDAVGTPVPPGNLLNGLITANQSLVADTEYEVVGTYAVATGATLTIPEGATLKFASTSALEVDGSLLVQGVSGNSATMTSLASSPARGDWRGIVIDETSTGSAINYAVIEYASSGIAVLDSASMTVTNSVIQEFSTDGIGLLGSASASIDTNLIDNSSGAMEGDGIDLDGVSGVVTIQDNEILGVNNGVLVEGVSAPAITGNEIWDNLLGIHLLVQGGSEPSPVISDNKLHTNTGYNLSLGTVDWPSAQSTTVDAENNYWGTIDPNAIATSIYDQIDGLEAPLVDFIPFLDADGLPVGTGGSLTGVVDDITTPLTAGTTYQVVTPILIQSGSTLTVPEGVVLEFASGTSLTVEGTLLVEGLQTDPVTFTSASGTPARGDWAGIAIGATSAGTSIDHAIIEFATRAVEISDPATAIVTNTTIREFSEVGLALSDGAGVSISDSLVDNSAGLATGDALALDDVTGVVTIEDSEIRGAYNGIRLTGPSTATVSGNEIWSNRQGILLETTCCPVEEPTLVISNNRLYANATYNLSTGGSAWSSPESTVLDLENNYWGTTDPQVISTTIFDLADDTDRPLVDFFPFLDGVGVPVVTTNVLFGVISDMTPLTEGTTYEVVSPLLIPAGATLTVPLGVTLKFGSGGSCLVAGRLVVQGLTAGEVTFTSLQALPARGDWRGIVLLGAVRRTTIDHAVIEYVERGVEIIDPAAATITNTTIREFSDEGILFNDVSSQPGAGGTIVGNVIDNWNGGAGAPQGNGVYVESNAASILLQSNEIRGGTNGVYVSKSSPQILDNTIEANADDGIEIHWVSSAVITGNEIRANLNGIKLVAGGTGLGEPVPTLDDNRIRSNSAYNLILTGTWPTVEILDATDNYWGSTNPVAIAALIYDHGDEIPPLDNLATVDFEPFLLTP